MERIVGHNLDAVTTMRVLKELPAITAGGNTIDEYDIALQVLNATSTEDIKDISLKALGGLLANLSLVAEDLQKSGAFEGFHSTIQAFRECKSLRKRRIL